MKESIYISNFGPIKEIEIEDVRPFTVFIGKSGIGKSTVLKILALFRWLFKRVSLRSYLKLSNVTESTFKFDFREYIKNGGLEGYLKPDTKIVYRMGACEISYNAALPKSLVAGSVNEWNEIGLEKICFISDKRNIVPEIASGSLSITIANYYLREILSDYLEALQGVSRQEIPFLDVALEVNHKAAKASKYKISGHGDNGSYSIRLQDASSGTQTVVPLMVILTYFSRNYDFAKVFNQTIFKELGASDKLSKFNTTHNASDLANRRVTLHIEEPELSLYPESQLYLLDAMAREFMYAERNYSLGFTLATHSPYIVNHMNLLAQRAKSDRDKPGIPYEKMAVYEIIDGYLNDLGVPEKEIFDTTALSEPLDQIYTEFNTLATGI